MANARGQSYWTLRRNIRKEVAAAMAVSDGSDDIPCLDDSVYALSDSVTDEIENSSIDIGDISCTVSEEVDDTSNVDHIISHETDLSSLEEESISQSLQFNEVGDDSSSLSDGDGSLDDLEDTLESFLVSWTSQFNIPQTALTALLRFLHKYHPYLPCDARTLLHTPRTSDIRPLHGGGEFWYSGVRAGIEGIFNAGVLDSHEGDVLYLQVSVDGLPLFRSSGVQLWPILCKIVGVRVSPFVVAVYSGVHKPADISDFLSEFVEEFKDLLQNGIMFEARHFDVVLHSFVCDAPARALLKGIKSHNAYFGCERCSVEGEYLKNRMVFVNQNAPPRTDESFRLMSDEDHHVKLSPLLALQLDMVSMFVLDPMHLLYLGVMRKLLHYWLRGPLPIRLTSHSVAVLSEWLVGVRHYIPLEFVRKPRSLCELDRWKATEFKMFLLYLGPVVLQLSKIDQLYNNFLLLFVACRILSSPDFVTSESMLNYAGSLLRLFVQDVEGLYGRESLVYNMHSLIHLTDDVRLHGSLDVFSAFPYENKLKAIKRMVRKPQHPLQQIIRRLTEVPPPRRLSERTKPTITRQHFCGPVPLQFAGLPVQQYSRITFPAFVLSLSEANSCALCTNGEPVVLCNILIPDDGTVVLVCKQFTEVTNLFDYPVVSREIEVHKVSKMKPETVLLSMQDIKCKCMRLPVHHNGSEHFVVLPLVHLT